MQLSAVLSPSIAFTNYLKTFANEEKFIPLRKATAFTLGIPVAVLATAETIVKAAIGIFVLLLSAHSSFRPKARKYAKNFKATARCIAAPILVLSKNPHSKHTPLKTDEQKQDNAPTIAVPKSDATSTAKVDANSDTKAQATRVSPQVINQKDLIARCNAHIAEMTNLTKEIFSLLAEVDPDIAAAKAHPSPEDAA